MSLIDPNQAFWLPVRYWADLTTLIPSLMSIGQPSSRARPGLSWYTIHKLIKDVTYLLTLSILVFTMIVPGQALAYSQYTQLGHQQLLFVRDPSLVDRAIVGIEAFPKEHTFATLFNNPSLRTTLMPPNLEPGTALRVLATAYSSTVDQTDADPFTTASGTRVKSGTMAANFLPFGTKVRIGSQIYTVQDRMNARYNGSYVVDLWQPSRQAANQFGVRVLEMEIITVPN